MARRANRAEPPPATEPPVSPRELERLRLKLGHDWPTVGIGAHLRRRAGMSQEFREFRDYQPGDDIRRVDWRASARLGAKDRWLARVFEAEEQASVAILVDARPAMRLPVAAPKLLFALWAARALATVATAGGDQATLAVFGGPAVAPAARLRGRGAGPLAAAWAEQVWRDSAPRDPGAPSSDAEGGLRALARAMRPAGVVILVSDMLFDPQMPGLDLLARTAQEARRTLAVLELDSFEAEAEALRAIPVRRLATVEGRGFPDTPVRVEADLLDGARRAMDAHRMALSRRWNHGGLVWDERRSVVRWPIDADRQTLAGLFRDELAGMPAIQAVAARGGGT